LVLLKIPLSLSMRALLAGLTNKKTERASPGGLHSHSRRCRSVAHTLHYSARHSTPSLPASIVASKPTRYRPTAPQATTARAPTLRVRRGGRRGVCLRASVGEHAERVTTLDLTSKDGTASWSCTRVRAGTLQMRMAASERLRRDGDRWGIGVW